MARRLLNNVINGSLIAAAFEDPQSAHHPKGPFGNGAERKVEPVSKLNQAYSDMLNGKPTEGTRTTERAHYKNPFSTFLNDDSLQTDTAVMPTQWQRHSDGTVTIDLQDNQPVIVSATEAGDTSPEAKALRNYELHEEVYRNEEGIHISTHEMERANAKDHGFIEEPENFDADEDNPLASITLHQDATDDLTMQVYTERQYDKNGLLSHRTINREAGGGPDNFLSSGRVDETYDETGRLHKYVYHSRGSKEDDDEKTTTIVDKTVSYDHGVLLDSYKSIDTQIRPKKSATVEYSNGSTEDVGPITVDDTLRTEHIKNLGDGTYEITKTYASTIGSNDKNKSTSTVIARDSEGKDIISGTKSETDINGHTVESRYDPKTKQWVPTSGEPEAAPPAAPLISGTVTSTPAEARKPTVAAPRF